MHRLAERCDGAVALKYFEPNDEVHPDNLLTVSDDDDLQVGTVDCRRQREGHASCCAPEPALGFWKGCLGRTVLASHGFSASLTLGGVH